MTTRAVNDRRVRFLLGLIVLLLAIATFWTWRDNGYTANMFIGILAAWVGGGVCMVILLVL